MDNSFALTLQDDEVYAHGLGISALHESKSKCSNRLLARYMNATLSLRTVGVRNYPFFIATHLNVALVVISGLEQIAITANMLFWMTEQRHFYNISECSCLLYISRHIE